MTDDQMDARLRRAGAAWRAATDLPVRPPVMADSEPLPLVAPAKPRPRLRRTGLFASAAVVAAALLAGAGLLIANIASTGNDRSAVEVGAVTLIGTPWNLVRITDAAGNDVPVAGNATLAIGDAHHLKGNDGCNSISGDIDVTASTIEVGTLASTEMACLDQQVTASAQHVDAMLSGSLTWTIDGDLLTLTKPGTGTLVYRAQAAPTTSTDPSDLTGVTWYLTTIESGGPDGVAHTVTGKPTLRIDGGLDYTDACNNYSGDATVGNGTLDVEIRTGSAVGCTGSGGQEAAEIAAVLHGRLTWVIEGNQLTITKGGVGALVYERKAPDQPTGTASDLYTHEWALWSIDRVSADSSASIGTDDLHQDRISIDANGHITISHRCYVDSGEVRVGDNTLDISHVTLKTAIPCAAMPDQQAEQDHTATMDDVLVGTSTWKVGNGRLSITKGDTTLVFLPSSFFDGGGPTAPASATDVASPDKLVGPAWRLTGIEQQTASGGSGSGSSDMGVDIRFDGKGHVRIGHACYVNQGDVQIGSGTLDITHVTREQAITCPQPGDSAVDHSVDTVLSGRSSWTISDGQLQITKGDTTLDFSAS
jgi:heat shock protein HslJ